MLLVLALGSFMDHFDFHVARMTTMFFTFSDDGCVCPEEHTIMVSTPGMMDQMVAGVPDNRRAIASMRPLAILWEYFIRIPFVLVVPIATSAALSVAKGASNTNRPMGGEESSLHRESRKWTRRDAMSGARAARCRGQMISSSFVRTGYSFTVEKSFPCSERFTIAHWDKRGANDMTIRLNSEGPGIW